MLLLSPSPKPPTSITFKPSPPPPHCSASRGTLFHYQGLTSTPILPAFTPLPHSGQFPFHQVDISVLRSPLFRCIRIGNSILGQSLLSSQHRQTLHICIRSEAGWLHRCWGRVCLWRVMQCSQTNPIFMKHSVDFVHSFSPSPNFLYVSFSELLLSRFILSTVSWSPSPSLSLLFHLPPVHPPLLRWSGFVICQQSTLSALLPSILPFPPYLLPTISPRAVPLCHWS